MKKVNCNYAEAKQTISELEKNGVIVTKPLPNLPAGLYIGKFVTQKNGKKSEPVINFIEYDRDGEKRAFPQVMVNIVNDETGDKYDNVGIALSDDVDKIIQSSANLANDYSFRAEKGRVRTFLTMAV